MSPRTGKEILTFEPLNMLIARRRTASFLSMKNPVWLKSFHWPPPCVKVMISG